MDLVKCGLTCKGRSRDTSHNIIQKMINFWTVFSACPVAVTPNILKCFKQILGVKNDNINQFYNMTIENYLTQCTCVF